jgi:hypothetical protein
MHPDGRALERRRVAQARDGEARGIVWRLPAYAAFAGRVVGDRALVPLELIPGDVGLVMILDQNMPFGHRPMHATPHALAPLLDAYLARRAPKGIGAGVDWIATVKGAVRRGELLLAGLFALWSLRPQAACVLQW